MVDAMKIGFVGLGNMGAGMAANLLAAGHEVTAYNRSQDKVAALAERGARAARTVAEACGGDVVITMLANDDAVEAVTFASDGILAALGAGATHVSSSTISVALAERLTEEHAAAGHRFVAGKERLNALGILLSDGKLLPPASTRANRLPLGAILVQPGHHPGTLGGADVERVLYPPPKD